MNSNLKAGIFQLIYSTFLHNSEAIALFVGIIICLGLLFKKPARIYLYFFLSFVFLLARFEYLKHIVDPLEQQTAGVMITENGHFRTKRTLDLFFNDLVPLVLYVGGWGSLFLGILKIGAEIQKKESKSEK